jgi:hypothetical protein
MADYQQKINASFSERRRLNRLRRKKEVLRFWDEFKLVPTWLRALAGILYVIALGIAIPVNLAQRYTPGGNYMFPPELRGDPVLASFALAGIITAVSLVIASLIFLVAYVNRDAKRRGMNSAVWTLLVIILLPAWTFLGFLIYFLMREPLPYPCPQCSAAVGARYNFCPNCKCNLHPSCPQCKREVVETDKFCPYCAAELAAPALATTPQPSGI